VYRAAHLPMTIITKVYILRKAHKEACHAEATEDSAPEQGKVAKHADAKARNALPHAVLAGHASLIEIAAHHVHGASGGGKYRVEDAAEHEEGDDGGLLLEVVTSRPLRGVELHPILQGQLVSEASKAWVGVAALANAAARQLLHLVVLPTGRGSRHATLATSAGQRRGLKSRESGEPHGRVLRSSSLSHPQLCTLSSTSIYFPST